jgi:hypothetical protein
MTRRSRTAERLEGRRVLRTNLGVAQRRDHAQDQRPSDALAVALRVDCPIFVEDAVPKNSANGSKVSLTTTSGDTGCRVSVGQASACQFLTSVVPASIPRPNRPLKRLASTEQANALT